jgi:hypothetical protein
MPPFPPPSSPMPGLWLAPMLQRRAQGEAQAMSLGTHSHKTLNCRAFPVPGAAGTHTSIPLPPRGPSPNQPFSD